MADTDKLAAEMLAGLEGVTPGPWTWGSKYVCRLDGTRYERLFQTSTGENEGGDSQWELNAAHIARCSPDNIRTLLEERSAREATITALEAENKRLADTIQSVLTWADQRCPCHNEQPNPCPLCGASVENLEACKSAENTFPRRLLSEIRDTLRRARDISRNRRES